MNGRRLHGSRRETRPEEQDSAYFHTRPFTRAGSGSPVWFSERGTLGVTAASLVEESETGFFATELEALLHVEVKGCLRKLIMQKQISRAGANGCIGFTFVDIKRIQSLSDY